MRLVEVAIPLLSRSTIDHVTPALMRNTHSIVAARPPVAGLQLISFGLFYTTAISPLKAYRILSRLYLRVILRTAYCLCFNRVA